VSYWGHAEDMSACTGVSSGHMKYIVIPRARNFFKILLGTLRNFPQGARRRLIMKRRSYECSEDRLLSRQGVWVRVMSCAASHWRSCSGPTNTRAHGSRATLEAVVCLGWRNNNENSEKKTFRMIRISTNDSSNSRPRAQ
jgi:hypothetical protein